MGYPISHATVNSIVWIDETDIQSEYSQTDDIQVTQIN